MFAKLLKHEWKASAGLLGIMSLAAVLMGAAGGFILRMVVGYASSLEYDDTISALLAPLTMVLTFLVFAVVACLAGVNLVLMFRFYKSKFTDEGYLTFTLPVSSHQIFLSSYTNMLIWSVLTVVAGILALLLFVGIAMTAFPDLDQIWKEFLNSLRNIEFAYGDLFAAEGYSTYQLLNRAYGIISWLVSPVLMMSCITLGAVLAKKHKLLAAVGVYYGLSMVIGTVTSMAEVALIYHDYNGSPFVASTTTLIVPGVQILFQIVLGVGGYFLSTWLMDHKLNLP